MNSGTAAMVIPEAGRTGKTQDTTKLVLLNESSPDRLGKGPLDVHLRGSWGTLTANCLAILIPEEEEASVDRALGL